MSILTALGIFVVAFLRFGRLPSLTGTLLALVMLVVAIALLYALWILTVSAAFYVVKIDNLTYLFSSIFDFARWPSSLFRGVVGFVFTFVLPLALMTTYPAEALLGRCAKYSLRIGQCPSSARADWPRTRRVARLSLLA